MGSECFSLPNSSLVTIWCSIFVSLWALYQLDSSYKLVINRSNWKAHSILSLTWRDRKYIASDTSMLLLLLSRFSRVWLCATPWTAAHQAPPSLGFSRQEHWSALPFPSPMHESEVAQSCATLSDPMDYSLPGSSIHGIFQARVLEWGAIAFSDKYVR